MLIYNSHLDPSMFDGSEGFDLSKIGACLTEEEDARKAGLFHEHENLWLVSHIKLPIKTVGVDPADTMQKSKSSRYLKRAYCILAQCWEDCLTMS